MKGRRAATTKKKREKSTWIENGEKTCIDDVRNELPATRGGYYSGDAAVTHASGRQTNMMALSSYCICMSSTSSSRLLKRSGWSRGPCPVSAHPNSIPVFSHYVCMWLQFIRFFVHTSAHLRCSLVCEIVCLGRLTFFLRFLNFVCVCLEVASYLLLITPYIYVLAIIRWNTMKESLLLAK